MYICEDTKEQVETYREYLLTNHWKNIKQKVYLTSVYKCSKCGIKHGLQLHHKTYERVGKELLSDLVYLCRDCHNEIHQLNSHGLEYKLKKKKVKTNVKKKKKPQEQEKLKGSKKKKPIDQLEKAKSNNKYLDSIDVVYIKSK